MKKRTPMTGRKGAWISRILRPGKKKNAPVSLYTAAAKVEDAPVLYGARGNRGDNSKRIEGFTGLDVLGLRRKKEGPTGKRRYIWDSDGGTKMGGRVPAQKGGRSDLGR